MSLLLALRERTRDAHDRLEAGLDVLHRCQDPASYAALLAGFRSVYAPLERELDTSPATGLVLPDWPSRRKTAWLDADLAALGASPRRDVPVPPLSSAEAVAGAAYVVEGATLGGAVLLRSISPTLPRRFFTSYGAERGRRWRAFRSQVEALPLERDAVVASAVTTFAAFERACLPVTR